MKIKALSRSERSISRECIGDVRLHHRNLDPTSHPHHGAREYARAVQSAKLDRMFAKPFLGALEDGHGDGVTETACGRSDLVKFVSGAVDGSVKVWDLASRKCVSTYDGAHSRAVTGLALCDFAVPSAAAAAAAWGTTHTTTSCLSCGEDGYIRQWKLTGANNSTSDGLLNTWRHPSKNGGTFKSLSVHWSEDKFATASDSAVDVWSPSRSSPLQSHPAGQFGSGDGDTVTVVRFNPSETDLLAHCGADRGIGLHDTRTSAPLRRTVLRMRSNCLEWNPMEPYVFAVGNEDHSCYSFDIRRLSEPTMIHRGHVGAVLSIGWAPTGREFVSGSYDKTIRIFPHRSGGSREMYFTKRMQRVFSVNYTSDNNYVISGSDDTNLRLWKARASEKVGCQLTTREEKSLQYRHALLKKHAHMPEVRRINRSGKRRGPKLIKKLRAMDQVQKESSQRKQDNRVKHSKPGAVEYVGERKKVVVKEID